MIIEAGAIREITPTIFRPKVLHTRTKSKTKTTQKRGNGDNNDPNENGNGNGSDHENENGNGNGSDHEADNGNGIPLDNSDLNAMTIQQLLDVLTDIMKDPFSEKSDQDKYFRVITVITKLYPNGLLDTMNMMDIKMPESIENIKEARKELAPAFGKGFEKAEETLKFSRLCEWLEIKKGNKTIDPSRKADYDEMFKDMLFPYGEPTESDSPTNIDTLTKLKIFNDALKRKLDESERKRKEDNDRRRKERYQQLQNHQQHIQTNHTVITAGTQQQQPGQQGPQHVPQHTGPQPQNQEHKQGDGGGPPGPPGPPGGPPSHTPSLTPSESESENGNGDRRRRRHRRHPRYYDKHVALALTNIANIGNRMIQQKEDEKKERALRDNKKEMTENEKYKEYVKRIERIRIENNVKLTLTRLLGGRPTSDLMRQINQIVWYEELNHFAVKCKMLGKDEDVLCDIIINEAIQGEVKKNCQMAVANDGSFLKFDELIHYIFNIYPIKIECVRHYFDKLYSVKLNANTSSPSLMIAPFKKAIRLYDQAHRMLSGKAKHFKRFTEKEQVLMCFERLPKQWYDALMRQPIFGRGWRPDSFNSLIEKMVIVENEIKIADSVIKNPFHITPTRKGSNYFGKQINFVNATTNTNNNNNGNMNNYGSRQTNRSYNYNNNRGRNYNNNSNNRRSRSYSGGYRNMGNRNYNNNPRNNRNNNPNNRNGQNQNRGNNPNRDRSYNPRKGDRSTDSRNRKRDDQNRKDTRRRDSNRRKSRRGRGRYLSRRARYGRGRKSDRYRRPGRSRRDHDGRRRHLRGTYDVTINNTQKTDKSGKDKRDSKSRKHINQTKKTEKGKDDFVKLKGYHTKGECITCGMIGHWSDQCKNLSQEQKDEYQQLAERKRLERRNNVNSVQNDSRTRKHGKSNDNSNKNFSTRKRRDTKRRTVNLVTSYTNNYNQDDDYDDYSDYTDYSSDYSAYSNLSDQYSYEENDNHYSNDNYSDYSNNENYEDDDLDNNSNDNGNSNLEYKLQAMARSSNPANRL